MRLLKFGPSKTRGLFEEYFYGFLLAIFWSLTLLLVAGGMGITDAMIYALWVSAFIWFGWQVKQYNQQKSNPTAGKKRAQGAKQQELPARLQPTPNMKPMIGPQWPLKTGNGKQPATVPLTAKPGNKAFVYERPTLPDRKPKLPANWPGHPAKKPKP